MRDHGTRACYVFGPQPGSDRSRGCRCEPCKEANRAYARARDRATRRPDEQLEPAYIDATEVREHLEFLRTKGVGSRAVADQAGVSRSAIQKIASGQRTRCTPTLADRVLLVFPSDARDGAYVPATRTWRLVRDLLAHGWTKARIARALGCATPALQIGEKRVTAATARKVERIHADALADVIVRREQAREKQRRYRHGEAA